MVLKTERMELRLDVETLERIDAWRARQDDVPSRSEALRRLIDGALQDDKPEYFRLNNREKLMTWLLTEILKNQIEERKDKTNNKYDLKKTKLIQEAIYGGHYWSLNWELQGVMHNHVDDPKDVTTVVNILDMWSFIERAYQGFSDADKVRVQQESGYGAYDPKFAGFDGNNESTHLSIARFLVEELGRFESFKGRDFNSHFPTVARYSQMATVFERMRPSLIMRELSPDQVIELLKRA